MFSIQEIDGLPTELRAILLDDMVTAFENRLNVLNNANRQNSPLSASHGH